MSGKSIKTLISNQFPQWADLPITLIEPGGWDNRSYRLGDDKVIRMPSANAYAAQVQKEQHWLPLLAPHLPCAIPEPLAMGEPGEGYSWHWSVYAWLPGKTLLSSGVENQAAIATALGKFLKALQGIGTKGAPLGGKHNFYRGCVLDHYDAQVREALTLLQNEIDTAKALVIWEAASAVPWDKLPEWVHGDISPANLLIQDNQLSAVIDFGCCCVGDPACDFAIAWTTFDAAARDAFKRAAGCDADTWLRGQAWALWKALILEARLCSGSTHEKNQSKVVLRQLGLVSNI